VTPVPFQFLTTGEDHLQIDSFNSQSGVRLALTLRFWDTDQNAILATEETHVPNTDRTKATSRHRLGVGAILNLRVGASAGTPSVGQTFVIVRVIRGFEGARRILGTLVQGYVTAEQDLAYPGSPIVSSTEGAPYTRVVVGTDPSPGNGAVETVPTGARWRVRAVGISLTSSAVAGDRTVYLYMIAGAGGTVVYSWHKLVMTASMGRDFTWALGMPTETVIQSNTGMAGLPDLILLAGSTVGISRGVGDAGDDFGFPTLYVDEWLEAK